MATTSSSRIERFRPYCSAGVQQKLAQATGLPAEAALRQLLAKERSIKAISERTGINRTQIYQALAFYKIEPAGHDHSAYMRQWYAEQPPETGHRLTAEAHKAVKGTRRSHDYQVAAAQRRQERGPASENERAVIAILESDGLVCTPQLAVDIFNIDVAIVAHRLAVEVNGGGWHDSDTHREGDEKKRQHLTTAGWTVVYLWGSLDEIEAAARKLALSLQSAHGPQP